MLVVSFDAAEANVLSVGGKRYFLFEGAGGKAVVVTASCPHRGGPLDLACYDSTGRWLICPWHETRIDLQWLLGTAVPSVRSGRRFTAFLPVPADQPVRFSRRTARPGSQPRATPLRSSRTDAA